ncbi:HEAT repeat domain-containing protein [Okeania hirsuta]|uniref:HEAT repeat domain-containing protein n=1 Tax=Okeania hirsuta TaxID=1458930 RepID=A0A3N6P231_9CYAN|nr:HEAT repeat domain-containing protein [Okeania hirsuta]
MSRTTNLATEPLPPIFLRSSNLSRTVAPGANKLRTSLLPLLQDEKPGVRSSATQVLGNLGNDSEPVVQALLPLLQDEDSLVRYSAAEALVKLGNGSEPVVQVLLALLLDEDLWVRDSAAEALKKLGINSKLEK